MDIQKRIDKIVEEWRSKNAKEWFDLVDAESLGGIRKAIESLGGKKYSIGDKRVDIEEVYQIISRSSIYWGEVLRRQKEVYMYKSLAEGMRSVIRSSSGGDIKSVKLLSDLMFSKLRRISPDTDEISDDKIFDVGDEELKEILKSRNEDETE